MSVQLLNRTTCVCTRALRKARLCLSESNASVFHWTSYHSSVTCSSPVGDDRGGPEQGPLGGLRSSGEARWSYAKGKGKRGPHGPDGALGLGGRISSEVRNLSKEDLPKRKPKTPQRARAEGGGKDSEIVFGVAPCLLALSQGRRTMTKLYVKKGRVLQRGDVQEVYERARRLGLEVQQVSKKELDQICSGRVHQGICLEASPLGYLPAEGASERDCVDSTETPLWLLLDGIQDPMNLGAILRSAYFLGVDRIASSLRNSCPLTPVVSKASSGAMEVMGVYGYESPANVLKVNLSVHV
ncbi:MRM1 methyltransferase, partial [Amia calva]|nr:MRM1 methyltransferase [Amia calva]